MFNVIMLSIIMLSVIVLSVIVLSVIVLSVFVLSVIMLSVIMLSVTMPSAMAPFVPGKPFKPSLIFETTSRLALSPAIRLGGEGFPGTNTLAYLSRDLRQRKKVFMMRC